jgi:ribosomal protein S18 acetylase RimI-like enzyme
MKVTKAQMCEIANLAKIEMSSGYHKKSFNFEPCLRELFQKNADVFCAKEGAFSIGYITLNHKGRIDYLAVSKKYQRKGVASVLLEKVISIAKGKKLKKLHLEVRNDNIPALRLYLKNGFIITSMYTKILSPGQKIKKSRMKKLI